MIMDIISCTATRLFVGHKLGYLRSLILALLLGGTACDSVEQTTAIPEEQANQVYWSLKLNHHAITLSTKAPWNTMQLAVVPLTYEEDTLSTEGAIVSYASNDTNAVSVTPDGTVLAKEVTKDGIIRVITRLTLGTITHADTAWVKVVDDPTPGTLQSFSIQPSPDDSAKIDQEDALGLGLNLSRFLDRPDQNGNQMTELIVYYRSLDEHVAEVDPQTGEVLYTNMYGGKRNVGKTRVIATAYAYGVSFTDTLLVTIGYPLGARIEFKERLRADGQGWETFLIGGGKRNIGTGGFIAISNETRQTLEVRFEDTTGIQQEGPFCAGPSLEMVLPAYIFDGIALPPCEEFLRFTQPGLYRYRNVQNGLSGVINVIDERLPLP